MVDPGLLRTNGWELQLSWRDRTSFGLGYSLAFNLSDSWTTITRYPGNSTHDLGSYIEGRQIGEIWGYETIGIAKTKEEMDQHLAAVGGQDALGNNWDAGDIMYADLDGKPGITGGAGTLEDHGDRKLLGNSTPRYFYGIDLRVDYKGFDVRAFFQGVGKRDIWNGTAQFFGVQGSEWWSVGYTAHEDYFRDEPIGLPGHEIGVNLDSYYPRPIVGTSKNQQIQSRYLQDASYIRLKNLQFGYTLPVKISNAFYCNNLRFYVSVDNLWTHTKASKVFDPETIDGGSSSRKWGNAYPLARTWSFGLTATF
ncbi:MAG: hypothetical protein NC102_01095 [Clostridium sp.]|nr:hypothetical protein [Clostridium sp.]